MAGRQSTPPTEHRDWRPEFDAEADTWRVARTGDGSTIVWGTSVGGTRYTCCCATRAEQLARAMNAEGHP